MNANTPTSSPDPQPHAAQVSERAPNQPRPPSNSQSQADNYRRNEKPSGAKVATAARSGSGTSKNNNVISFTLNWICVVLTVAATIVFGIWAPLSYRATADGNRDNNVVQSSMMQQVMTANDIASSALNSASAQSTVMASMQSRLGAMGQLAILDFCLTQTVCTALLWSCRDPSGTVIFMIPVLMGSDCIGVFICPQRGALDEPGELPGVNYASK